MAIKKSPSPLPWFALFNLTIYTAVFMGRILRDSYLFTQPGGERLLPLVFVINAVVVTWVGSQLGNWEKKFGKTSLFIRAYGGSGIFFLAFSFLFLPSTLEFLQALPTIIVAPVTWVAFFFYFLSEVPIFLFVNLIWILAGDYFTDIQGNRDFPRISSVGLIGVAVASLVVLLTNYGTLPIYYLNFMWGILSFVLLGISLGILYFLKPVRDLDEQNIDLSESEIEKSDTFLKVIQNDFKWVRGYPFLWLFTIVTICNFVLLAIFDQTLANGARHIGVSDQDLSILLATWTLGFGIFAAFFSWFIFPRIFDKQGRAIVNLYAPSFMLLGVIGYLVVASDFLDPIWKNLIIFDRTKYLLSIVIFSRIAGWCAEFLFNQSMLPFVYGALPVADESRARFFVEGPVTAITNGLVGFFLLLYFAFFRETSEGYGYKLDLLFVIAAFVAVMMWILSRQMVPLFGEVLRKRANEGELDFESTGDLVRYHRDINVNELGKELVRLRKDNRKFPGVLKNISMSGQDAIDSLVSVFSNEELTSVNRALVIRALADLNALQSTEKVWHYYKIINIVPTTGEISALKIFAQHFGQGNEVISQFTRWLSDDFVVQPEQKGEILKSIYTIGLDGSNLVSEYISKKLRQDNPHKEINDDKRIAPDEENLVIVAAELGSTHYFEDLIQIARKDNFNRWDIFGKIQFYSHKHLLKAFSMLLAKSDDIGSGASLAMQELLLKNTWLVWPLLWLVELSEDELPEELRSGQSLWPILIARMPRVEFELSQSDLFLAQFKNSENGISPELDAINWWSGHQDLSDKLLVTKQGMEIAESINYVEYLVERLEIPESYAADIEKYSSFVQAFYEMTVLSNHKSERHLTTSLRYSYDSFYKTSILMRIFDSSYFLAWDWLRRRRVQWLRNYLLLLTCEHSLSREIITPKMADDLLLGSEDIVKKDRAISLLEQSGISRELFIKLRTDLDDLESPLLPSEKSLEREFGEKISLPLDMEQAKSLWHRILNEKLQDQLLRRINTPL